MEKSHKVGRAHMGHCRAIVSPLGLSSHLWSADAVLLSQQHNAQLVWDAFESTITMGCRNLAHLEATSCHGVFLEDHEIAFPDPLDAPPRRRFVHRFADQSVRLSLGAAFASPGCFFQSDHHRDHAQIEARGGFARLPRDAFSCPLFNSLRNLGDIEQSGITRYRPYARPGST